MAPEVILAMDEGQYDGKVDVWSLGITCIELAERKPPYFNMNAMSALYHIAQNDSPTLQAPEWTDTFRYFVEACLQKNPQDRLSSTKLLSHPFITRPRSPNVLVDLIQRTKAAVRDLDNLNYRKMKKILMVDVDNESAIGDSEETAEEPSGGDSSKSNSATSEHSAGVASSQSSSSGSLRRRAHAITVNHMNQKQHSYQQQYNHQPTHTTREESNDDYVNRDALREYANRDSLCDDLADDYANRDAIREAQRERECREYVNAAAVWHDERSTQRRQSDRGMSNNVSAAMSLVSEHGANNFATIRTTSIVTNEQKEHKQEMHEQMSGYKRMRREHQAALVKLEERCKADKQNVAAEKKLIKDITARQEQERKSFDAQRKREYKANKERWKKELSMDDATPKRQRDATLQSRSCSESWSRHTPCSCGTTRRRRSWSIYFREEQLSNLHATELANQREYMQRAEHELRKKHALQLKQQPKSLKIRKQFRETCKIQTRQYKALKAQILQTTPKEQQKEVIKSLKDEKRRKLVLLGEQYDQSISEMLQKQTVRLDESQMMECQQLKMQLEHELDMLTAYQSKSKMQAEAQRNRERRELEERVNMEYECAEFVKDRADRTRALHERHARDLERFDDESARLGFSAMAIAEGRGETFGDEEQSLSGSMLSLAHSNSSTSFPAGSL
ncbi:unnamed protein product [Leptidea sinapis]|uniref:non-specific serine/threonine protein kinase n=1 Tax=Leptidea sinapis TaxID=189913 RepID=A0A5E4Q4E4_9NEOP|nr:unnamed protein product [Leptidea sinapis]